MYSVCPDRTRWVNIAPEYVGDDDALMGRAGTTGDVTTPSSASRGEVGASVREADKPVETSDSTELGSAAVA
ncbi:hypothetical protein [Thermoleptolyngbya sp.]